MMEFIGTINNYVWGPGMLVLLGGTGLYLTIRLRFLSFRQIPHGFAQLWKGRQHGSAGGELSPFNALMLALAGTIGTGNIAGVATAIMIGGPGAIFWMWMTAFLGMATKFAEIVVGVYYREKTPAGNYVGGAMYAIKNGLPKHWHWLAIFFCLAAWIACIGTGNLVQGDAIASTLNLAFGIPHWLTALLLFLAVGAVLLGGVKRIGEVAGKVVPLMALIYIVVSIFIILTNISEFPKVFGFIIKDAFSPSAAAGGFAGATTMMAIRMGMARGIYSNEAGLGTSPIAHATASTASPVRQGFIGMLDAFIDTIIVCSMTAFVIMVTGAWTFEPALNGAPLTAKAFETALSFIHPNVGSIVVSVCLTFFAFTTILAWAVYGERSCIYLIGDKAQKPYRCLYTILVPCGCIWGLDVVWLISDTFNALMVIPNLIALLMLSPKVFELVDEYMKQSKNGDIDLNGAQMTGGKREL